MRKHYYCRCIDLYGLVSLCCVVERGVLASSEWGLMACPKLRRGLGAHEFRMGDPVPERTKRWVGTTCILSRCVVSRITYICILLWTGVKSWWRQLCIECIICYLFLYLCILYVVYIEFYFSPFSLYVDHHEHVINNQE